MQKNVKNKNITFAFIFLVIVDVLAINYENGYISIIGPVVKLIAYSFIINEVIRKVKIKEVKKPIFLFVVIVVALNLFLVYQTVWTTFLKIEDYNESVLYIIYGSINVLMCIMAINYHSRYSSKHSLYYLYFH
ncbi:MAG: hypothetical protein QNK89_00265 [Lacinutrix sp.]|uniref:hypothetical protein n=1 Tax=Lacinutrix sp. TaxID=1937692 RepID=UPI00309CE262